MRRLELRQTLTEPSSTPPTTTTGSDSGIQFSSTPTPNGIESENIATAASSDLTSSTSPIPTSRVVTIADPNNGSPTVVTLPPITNGPPGQQSPEPTYSSITSTPSTFTLPPTSTTVSAPATSSSHASSSGLKHSYLLIAILVPVLIVFFLLPLSIFALWLYRRRRRNQAGRHQSMTSRQHLRSESGGSIAGGARTPTPMEMSQYQDHGYGRDSFRSKDANVSSHLTDEPMTPPICRSSSGRDNSRGLDEFDLGFHFGDTSNSQASQVERNGRPSLHYERGPPAIHDPNSIRDSDASGTSGLGIGVAHGGDSWYMPHSQDNPNSREVRVSNEMPPRRSEIASFGVVSPASEMPERSSRFTRESGISDIVSPMSERNSRFHRRSDHEPVSPIHEGLQCNSRPNTRRSSRGVKKNLASPPSEIRPESDLLPAILAAGSAAGASAGAGKRNSRRPGHSGKRSSGSPPKLTSANLNAHAKASSDRPHTAGHDRSKSASPFSHPDDDDQRSISEVSGVVGERDPDEVSFVSSLGAEELERRKSERSLKRTVSSPGEASKSRKRSGSTKDES